MPAKRGEPLSKRELEIVKLVADGLTNREIAYKIERSPNTIKVHLRNVFTKTDVASRTELTVLAMQEGWIDVPGVVAEPPTNEATEETASEATPTALASPITSPPNITAEASSVPANVIPAASAPVIATILPEWSHSRWVALAVGLLVALAVLLLPQRPVGQAAAPTGSGLIDQPETPLVAAEPATEDGWVELAPLPTRRARMGTTAFQGQIYTIGGVMEDGVTDQLDIYNIVADEWRTGAPYPDAVANVDITPVTGGLLVAGGCDANGQPSADVHLYEPGEDAWTEVAPLPEPLCAYAISTFSGRAYLFGGWNGAAYQTVAYAYNGDTDTWKPLAAPTEARGFGAATTLSNRIFYVGGYDDQRELTTCEVYLPNEDRWESCAPLLQPRGGLGLASVGGRLFALGGGWTSYLGFNERYDPTADAWTVIETPIVGEWRNLGLTVGDTSLYAIGGWSGDYINRVYTFEALPWRLFIPTTFSSP